MKYREKGDRFCEEINQLLKQKCPKTAFVTGGGYAYDSIKYYDDNTSGDFDFMIIYDEEADLTKLIQELKHTNFSFEDKYLDLDLKLLEKGDVDIIRLSGNYIGTKSTINLVPLSLVKEICELNKERIIKKIAHNRNTSLFFAYGSDNTRITVNFISPSFVTPDNEDHYIHLDFSSLEKDNNIYLGILSDAILKGFNKNYDNVGFSELRQKLINNINNYFKNNNIKVEHFLNMFSNNAYFPEHLKEQLLEEFKKYGVPKGIDKKRKNNYPIIFSTTFNSEYEKKPFNFINNKKYNMRFVDYIKKMQNNEYDRQYLLDAIGKFYGYLISSEHENRVYEESDILQKMEIYGTNDIFLPQASNYSVESIIETIIKNLKKEKDSYNNELIKQFLLISTKFLSLQTSANYECLLRKYDLSNLINETVDSEKIELQTIKKLSNFNEIGTYHNLTSEVMPGYTNVECEFLNSRLENDKSKKILDIMCGYGRLANKLKERGYKNICGIDNEEYNVFNIPKDFTYICDDFINHKFDDKFDFAYSLYNCYDSNDYLYNVIMKANSVLNPNGELVIDCFNKKWRDSIDPFFEKVLYKDDNYKLVVNREYDKTKGQETTRYTLYYKNIIVKTYEFKQKFFSKDDVLSVVDSTSWDYELHDSSVLHSRTNNQKHVMVLRRKI